MNHVFKNIWNAVNQCWTAVSELSKSAGKSSKTDKRKVLNAIIGAAVLAGVSTTAIAETNVISDDQGNVIGGIGAKALAGTGTTGNSVVLGNKAKSERTESVVIGSNATNTGRWSVTLGDKAEGNSQYGVTIGNRANGGKGGNAIAIGLMAKATNEKVGGNSQTAVGVASYADGEGASAFGATANATGVLATAVGRNSKALAKSASAFGDSASASAWGATAVGIGANASAIVSTAVGNGAKASAVQAAALGNEAKATGSSSTAIGVRSNSAGSSAIAVGTNSAASANNAVSIGTGSKATGSESTAIGYASKAEGVNSMAMGRESSATHENSVALGSYSVSKAEKSIKEATVGTTTYNGFAGTTPKGTVSVGTKGRERQIVNVAAGEISATSTDAINGSQLYAVASKISSAANPAVVEAGKNVTVDVKTNANGQTVYTVSGTDFQPAIDANKANIAKNADAINTNTADIRSAEKLIDMNAKDIAQNTKDIAANTNYIKAVEQKLPVVTAGKNTTVDISTDANGKVTYTVSSTDYQPAIDKNAKGVADNTKAIESNKAKIADVEAEAKRHTIVEAGHNMEVTSSKDENGATVYKVATSKDIGVNSLTVYNGPKITKDGIDARNTKIKNVTAGEDDNDAVNVSQLNQVKARQDAQSRALKQVRRTVINHGARLTNVENRVTGLENKVDRLDQDVKKNRKRADAGIAAVAAMANIPQVYLPGKSGVGVGVGYKHGQSSVAVGYSRSSDSGHHIIKLSAGVDTQKDVTVGAGYMYQW
nr:MAG TPA: hypothetical protein [Caudoviricetes sp.]